MHGKSVRGDHSMTVMRRCHLLVLSWLLRMCLSCRECSSTVVPVPSDKWPPAGCMALFCHEQSSEPQEQSKVLLPNLSEDLLSEETFGSAENLRTRYEQEHSTVTWPWMLEGLGAPQWDKRNLARWKRLTARGKPNSLDLTFHLLRELIETSKAKKMVQKVQSNQKLLQAIGK
ncbi:corticoliberin-like [Arapaima gigas]